MAPSLCAVAVRLKTEDLTLGVDIRLICREMYGPAAVTIEIVTRLLVPLSLRKLPKTNWKEYIAYPVIPGNFGVNQTFQRYCDQWRVLRASVLSIHLPFGLHIPQRSLQIPLVPPRLSSTEILYRHLGGH